MGDMCIAAFGVEDLAGFRRQNGFLAVVSNMHVDLSVQHHKHLWPVIHVPFVGLIRPMQPHGGPGDLFDVQRRPGLRGGEVIWHNFPHFYAPV